jgi:hypothetical protein
VPASQTSRGAAACRGAPGSRSAIDARVARAADATGRVPGVSWPRPRRPPRVLVLSGHVARPRCSHGADGGARRPSPPRRRAQCRAAPVQGRAGGRGAPALRRHVGPDPRRVRHGPWPLSGARRDRLGRVGLVPSSMRTRRAVATTTAHPLHAVCDATTAFGGALRMELSRGPGAVRHLRPSADAFVPASEVAGCRVLVVDDTWTTGAHALSAAAALTGSGATVTGILVIGRAVDPGAAPGVAAWWRCHVAGSRPAVADGGACRCCLEPGARSSRGPTRQPTRERSPVPR